MHLRNPVPAGCRQGIVGQRHPSIVLYILAGLAFWSVARGADLAASSNPYHLIAKRNVFGLRPAQPVHVQQPAPPLPNVTLTGITTILKGKRALLKIQFPAKPPVPAKVQSCILAEGQSEGSIQVLEINEKTPSVKIDNSRTVMTITFPKTPPAAPAFAAPRSRPYMPRLPVQAVAR